ncbi:MAG: type II CAAX endopeptidase family protein [Actinomycetota bacterium]
MSLPPESLPPESLPPESRSTDPDRSVPWRAWDLVLALVLGFVGGVAVVGVLLAFFPRLDDLETTRWLFFAGGTIYLFELFFAWLLVLKRRGATFRDAGLVRPSVGAVLLMIPAILGVFLVEGIVAQVVVNLFGPTPTAEDQLLGSEGVLDRAQIPWVVMLTVVVAPIVEEIVFRGLLYGYLRSRMSIKVAAPISALIFACFHFIPLLIPSLFVLGIALAFVYERYKSILVPMALHALNNGIVVWALYAST